MSDSAALSPLGLWLRGRIEGVRAHARGVGIFLAVAGSAGAVWVHRAVFHYAQLHAPVGGLPAAFVIAVLAGVLGVVCVIGGAGAVDTLQRKNLSWLRYGAFLTVFLALPVFLAFMWMLHVLDEFET